MTTLIKKHLLYFLVALIGCSASAIVCERFAVLITNRFDRIVEAKNTLAAYDENKKIFAEESKKLASLNDRATALDGYRVTKATIPNLLSSTEKLGAAYNLTFTITSVATPIDSATGNEKLTIDFSAKGTPVAIDAFLKALSSQAYEVNYANFSLATTSDDTVTGDPGTDTVPPAPSGPAPWQVNASVDILSY